MKKLALSISAVLYLLIAASVFYLFYSPDSPKEQGDYYRTAILEAEKQNDREKADALVDEMMAYLKPLSRDERIEFESSWPEGVFTKIVISSSKRNLDKVQMKADGWMNQKDLKGGMK